MRCRGTSPVACELACCLSRPLACQACGDGGGVDLWTPEQISTAIWVDASDAATITESGGSVSQWDDKSGGGHHFAQANAAFQPTTGATTLGGLNVLDFDEDFMNGLTTPFATISDAFLIFVVDSGSSGNTWFSLSGDQTGTQRWNALGNLSYDTGDVGAGGRLTTTYSNANPGTYGFESNVTDDTKAIYQNGIVLASNTAPQSVTPPTTANIGGRQFATYDMSLGEWIAIDGQVTTATRQRLEGYLAWKWGLVDNLPADHPYKNAPPVVDNSFDDSFDLSFAGGTTPVIVRTTSGGDTRVTSGGYTRVTT